MPPLRVIRRDVGNLRGASLGVLALGTGGFAALLLVVSSDVKLGVLAVVLVLASHPLLALFLGGGSPALPMPNPLPPLEVAPPPPSSSRPSWPRF